MAAFVPMTVSGGLFGWSIQVSTEKINKSYETSGGYAEQALLGIKTVLSLNGITKEVYNYSKNLGSVQKVAEKYGIITGIGLGSIFFSIFADYALGLWYGSKLIEEPGSGYRTGDVLICFFSVSTSTMTLGSLTPAIKAFAQAKEALIRATETLERRQNINSEDDSGAEIERSKFKGEVSFKSVNFSYPSRPEQRILNRITFDIKPGEKTALVGESGCGKTTCFQLIERFYDAEAGTVLIDGVDVKDLKVSWLRKNIGYVGQEPVLFGMSIRENLRLAKEDATEAEMIDALKMSNAWDFIYPLEKRLDTYVGPGGAQLSGGQKQRIAIARAIIKNPRILLLDEATSALDRQNEIDIQATLDKFCVGRTTIFIAHRLTTIQNADKIIVIQSGEVCEQGTHQELLNKGKKYFDLQKAQLKNNEDGEENQEEEIVEEKNEEEHKSNLESIPLAKRQSSRRPPQLKTDKSTHEDPLNKTTYLATLEKKYVDKDVFKRLFSYNNDKKLYVFLTLAFGAACGVFFPLFALLFAEILEILNEPYKSDYRERCDYICLMFLVLAILSWVTRVIEFYAASALGESTTKKIRTELYHKILKMDMTWFDEPRNSTGMITTKLQADVTLINQLIGSIMSIMLESAASLITGVVIALVASWQITLCLLATTPLITYCGKIQEELNSGFSKDNVKAYEESMNLLTESILNMRTVASYAMEKQIFALFEKKLEEPRQMMTRKSIVSGVVFGVSQFLIFAIYALTFYVGILFMYHGYVDFKKMYTAIFGLMFAAFGSGAASQYMPDVGKAKQAAREIFDIFDTKPLIEYEAPSGIKGNAIKGDIEFENVSFKYPMRKETIFENLSFKINAFSKIGLVGPSGCGKSTIFQLILRFYDPDSGRILLDGIDIKYYDLEFLRENFGVVQQEPLLFNGTIEYNISYKKPDATEEEIRRAASLANALKFIENNEFDTGNKVEESEGVGFKRKVGAKGSQISGGQKQRIAIARAIINNPKILLLDEATSALDAESEKVVQESLQNITSQNITSLTIAHRLSTIKNVDEILVFHNGKIIERGGFDELMKKKQYFYKLAEGTGLGIC